MAELTAVLPKVRSNKPAGLDLPEPLLFPMYIGGSILNIPATVSVLFGLPSFGHGPFMPEILDPLQGLAPNLKRVILVLVDALAYHRLKAWMSAGQSSIWGRLAQDGLLAPITSVFPSTTSTALPTIWSGFSPAEHGMVGYELWLREYGVVANMITHSPMYVPGMLGGLEGAGFDPEKALPGKVLGTRLVEGGVKPYAFQHYTITRSGLSRMFLIDTAVQPYGSDAELWINMRHLIEAKADEKMFVGVYWGRVDSLSHIYGPDDERPEAEFAHFSDAFTRKFLEPLSPELRKDTLVMLMADHGQITTPKQPHYELSDHPDLLRRLHIRPTGENRATYYHIRPGQYEAVREYLERKFMGQFLQFDPGYAVEHGLFGPGTPHPRLKERIGDLLTLAKGPAYLWWGNEPSPLLGRHGGLHEEEMIVPFLAAPL